MLRKLKHKNLNKSKLKLLGLVILLLALPLFLSTLYFIQDIRSRAALPDNLETESGVLSSSGVSTQSDSNTSGGQFVLFNNSSNPTPTPATTGKCSTGQVFDVSAYGASPNDTVSDQNAIVSAINAAKSAGGGRVTFTEGMYLSGMISVTGANDVALCGQGMDKTRIEQTGGSKLLVLRSSSRFSIVGITLDGKSLPTTTYLIDIQDSPEFVFDSSAVRNVNDATLNNVFGLYISIGSPNALIINSLFDNIRGYGAARGVSTNNYRDSSDAISGLRVLDSHFSNILSRPSAINEDSDGIVFATLGHMTDGLVENNTFHNIGKRAVKSMANGTVVRCNKITRSIADTSYSAISVYGNDHLVENNTITSKGSSTFYYNIELEGSRNIAYNNKISGDSTSAMGIYLPGGNPLGLSIYGVKQGVLVKDNSILDVQHVVTSRYGDPPIKNVKFTGNTTCATTSWWRSVMDEATTNISGNTSLCGVAPITRNGTFTPFSIRREPNPTCSR